MFLNSLFIGDKVCKYDSLSIDGLDDCQETFCIGRGIDPT